MGLSRLLGIALLGILTAFVSAYEDHEHVRAFGSDFVAVTDYTKIPFVIRFEHGTGPTADGLGLAYNAQWVITNYAVGSAVNTALTGNLYPVGIETTDFTTPTTVGHIVKAVVLNPDFDTPTDPHDDMALIRVCPKLTITTFVSLPDTASLTYNPGNPIYLYAYDGAYKLLDEIITFESDCSADTLFTTEANFCVFCNGATCAFDTTDRDKFVFVLDFNGAYIGHVTTVLAGATYKFTVFKSDFKSTWITGNTLLIQY